MTDASPVAGARALIDLGRQAEAVRALAAHLAMSPDDSAALCVLALAEIGLQRYDRADTAARAALRLEPDDEWAHRLVAIAATGQRHWDEAIRHADESIRLGPFAWQAYFTRAQVDIVRGKVSDTTEATAREATRLAPFEATTHTMMGRVLIARRHYRSAEEALREALRLDPQSAAARRELARIELRRRRFGSAASGFSSAAALQPTDSLAARNLVVAMHRMVAVVNAVVLAGFWVVLRFHDDRGRPPVTALRIVWLVCATFIVLFVIRMARQLGDRAPRVVRQAAQLNRGLAVWAAVLAAALVVCGVAVVVPDPLRLRLEAVAALLAAASMVLSWVSAIRMRRLVRRR